jgi:Transposase DDE domain
MPFKVNQDRRHHIPRQRHKVMNWAAYDAALRQRGSLTIWFSEEAIAGWQAEPRTTPGGQPSYSDLAIATALTLRAVFRLALRQTEGLVGSILELLGLALAVPDHTTLSRRAETLELPRPRSSSGSEPLHLLVDSTGLRLGGPGEWLVEKHGGRSRRSWRKLHLGVDADTGRIVAAALTDKEVDDGSQVGPLLDRIDGAVASVTADGAFDRDDVYSEIAARHPEAAVIVPPRSGAVPSGTAETAPTRRDRHLEVIAARGRRGWQKASGYNWRALVEADIARWKRVIGDALRSQTDGRQATEVAIAVRVLNRMLDFGRPEYVRLA